MPIKIVNKKKNKKSGKKEYKLVIERKKGNYYVSLLNKNGKPITMFSAPTLSNALEYLLDCLHAHLISEGWEIK